ncbi:hypothetical protein NF212_23680 [Parasalinivibrio latis]|uniref:hypothetical protein n=1 Tax=Parasalinivibrio latis TaxID=2952610 RepID=UPI0030E41E55
MYLRIFFCVLALWAPSSFALDIYIGGSETPALSMNGGNSAVSIPNSSITTHTPWTDTTVFEGFSLKDLLSELSLSNADIVAVGLNGYTAVIPSYDIAKFDPIVAEKRNGKTMKVRDLGPYWIIYPFNKMEGTEATRAERRMVWQLKSLRIKSDGEAQP